jgi:uncharacterized membrane protein
VGDALLESPLESFFIIIIIIIIVVVVVVVVVVVAYQLYSLSFHDYAARYHGLFLIKFLLIIIIIIICTLF